MGVKVPGVLVGTGHPVRPVGIYTSLRGASACPARDRGVGLFASPYLLECKRPGVCGDAAVYGGLNLAVLADPARPFLAKRAAVYRVQHPRPLVPSVRRARRPHPTRVFALSGRPRDDDRTLGAPPVGGLLSYPLSGLSGDRGDVIRVLCALLAPIRPFRS